jgi:hypothetical protein
MNLVGKIFTFLIFVMCIVFSAFALMLHAGHTNWRNEYIKQTALLDTANLDKAKLQQAYTVLEQLRTTDKDSANKQIGKLQADYDGAKQDKLNAEAKASQLQSDMRVLVAASKAIEQNLADIRTEAEALRAQTVVAVDERQKVFDNLVKATTDVTTLNTEIARIQKQLRDLAAKFNEQTVLTQYAKITPADMQKDPPGDQYSHATVTGVRQSDVEISLGSDDGVRPGHRFSITRPSTGQYVGDVVVVQVPYPNRAIARAVKETMRDQIQKYDHVQASLSKKR